MSCLSLKYLSQCSKLKHDTFVLQVQTRLKIDNEGMPIPSLALGIVRASIVELSTYQ
jgi:hypothetical protein